METKKEKIILELEIIDVSNPINLSDPENYKNMPDGFYAVFDGLVYSHVQIMKKQMWGCATPIPAKYIKRN